MSVTKKMIQQLQKEIHDTPQYKESIALAKIALLDYLACYSARLQSAKRKGLLQASLEKAGSHLILLTPYRTSKEQSALLSGYLAHYHDLDGVQANFRGHPSAVIFSALLAVSDADDSFERLLAAYVQGMEFAGRIGLQCQPQHIKQGWHSTATIGSLAAAVAIGYFKTLPLTDILSYYR
ncbi:MmgE/PrpD family protein [Streptococcus alactolyticus]|uniref:MmgE/PrpD family protein n=1 Tax=Streptococcus alactolyticus TaxID=29389 RepID=UPI0035128018